MKIIHTSDWHFGKHLSAEEDYSEAQRFFLEQLYSLIRKEKVEAVICAGDVYDSAQVKGDAIRLFGEAATKICLELGVAFIVIAGNHDSAARLSSCNELLKAAKMYVTGELERDPEPIVLDGGKVAIYPVPYFERNTIAALFEEKSEQIRTVSDGARVLLDHMRQSLSPDRRNILVSHCYLTNAEKSESDVAARLGNASSIPKDVFEGFDYVALGHIHKPQVMAPHIRYSGSPIKFSFGSEEEQKKGVVLIDTDTMEQTFLPIAPMRDRKTLKGTYEELIHQESFREYENWYLRLEVTDRYRSLELQTEMKKRFPYLLELDGKRFEDRGGSSTLSLEEIRTLGDTELLCKFLEECYGGYKATEEEIELFREALEYCEKEADVG